jgi:glycosyltransferase involved in cell wall biosynthesis
VDSCRQDSSKISKEDIRIAVMGSSNWLEVIAELLRRAGMSCDLLNVCESCSFLKWVLKGYWLRFWIVRSYDVVHHIGGCCNWRLGMICTLFGKPVVWHWIGSDIVKFKDAGLRSLRGLLYRLCAHRWAKAHLADSPELAEELQELGIQARVVRLLPKLIEADIEPLPQKFSVLSYWWDGRKELYGGDVILRLAEEFGDVEFKIVCATGAGESALPNVKFLGFQDDMSQIYSQSSVLIRLPIHDSLSAMVLEMFARGRYVIYNQRLRGVHFATSLTEAREALYEIRQKTEPNSCGAQMVREHFSLDKEAQTLSEIYRDIVGEA